MDFEKASKMVDQKMLADGHRPIDDKALNDWLKKIELVQSTVRGLRDGSVTVEEADNVNEKVNRKALKKQRAEEEKRREQRLEKLRLEKLWREGRPGKGTAEDYDKYCQNCMLEYKEETTKCFQCSKDLIPRDERRQFLCDKVNVLIEEKNQRKIRRARFQQWQANRKDKDKTHKGTDYDTWDFWEPSSATDEDPQCPDTPEFKAMEADMKERAAKRKERERQSEIRKEEGNKAVRYKNYKDAIGFYGQAIEFRKDNKYLYTNRALVYLYLGKFRSAEKDCNTALDIWECLESGKERLRADESRKFATKAYLRRCAALRGQKKYEAALEDMQSLLSFDPTNKEALKMASQVLRDVEEAKKAEEVLKECEEPNKTAAAEPKAATAAAAKAAKAAVDIAKGTPFERISACLAFLRDFNASVAKAIDAINEWQYMEPEEKEVGTEPAEPTVSADLGRCFRALEQLLENSKAGEAQEKNSIYFREKKGIITMNKTLKTTLQLCKRGGGVKDAAVAFASAVKVLLEACDNEHSKEAFVRGQGLAVLLEALSTLDEAQSRPLANCTLKLTSFVVEHPAARAILHRDVEIIWSIVVKYGVEGAGEGCAVESSDFPPIVNVLNLLCNCSFDARFRKGLRNAKPKPLDTLVPLVAGENKEAAVGLEVASRVWGALANLLGDQGFRKDFTAVDDNLEAVCAQVRATAKWYRKATAKGKTIPMVRRETFKKMLALALNCAVESELLTVMLYQKDSKQLVEDLTFLVLNPKVKAVIRERCGGLLARGSMLADKKEGMVAQGVCEALLSLLMSDIKALTAAEAAAQSDYDVDDVLREAAHEHSWRGLAALTLDHNKACEKVLRFKRKDGLGGVELCMRGLRSKNAQIAGNVCNVVSHVVTESPSALDTFHDAIPHLIDLMKVEEPKTLGKNAAIACAKLARHPGNIELVRKLKGMELMYVVGQRK